MAEDFDLAHRQGIQTPQQMHLWGLTFAGNPVRNKNEAMKITYWIESSKMPSFQMSLGYIWWMNGVSLYPGKPRYDSGDENWPVTIYLWESMAGYNWLDEWYNNIYNIKTGTMTGTSKHYDEASIFLLNSLGTRKTIEVKLHEVLLVNLGQLAAAPLSMNPEGDQLLTVTAEFKYNWKSLEFDQAI